MAVEERDLEPYLSVGCPVVLHSDPFAREAPRYNTLVRGWRKGSYLLLDRPKISGRYAAMRENHPCVIRFVRDGVACAFDSLVFDWDTRQHNAYCRIEWPKSVKIVAFRKFERTKTELPCEVFSSNFREEARIEDFSIGGCRVALCHPIDVGAGIELTFSLPDGCVVERAKAIVRNVQGSGESFYIGCSFAEGQVSVESSIAFYLTASLDRRGTAGRESDDTPRIVVVDDTPEKVVALRDTLRQRGFDVLIAVETIEALSRLRVAAPAALLIKSRQHDLPGIYTARLVKMTRGLERLPVFLYGMSDQEIEMVGKQAIQAGCLKEQTSPIQIANTVAAAIVAAHREGGGHS